MPEVKKRKSPIGYEEYEGIVNPSHDAETGKDLKAPYQPYSVYNKATYDNPEIQFHERIHQGQFATKDYPPKQQVIDTILNGLNLKEMSFYHKGNPGFELPAYQFDHYDSNNQQAFNNYINLINQTTQGQAHNIQAPMPIEYQKGYVNSGPEVQTPQIPMQEMSLLDMLVKMTSKKK